MRLLTPWLWTSYGSRVSLHCSPTILCRKAGMQLLFHNELKTNGSERWSCVMPPDISQRMAVAVKDTEHGFPKEDGKVLHSSAVELSWGEACRLCRLCWWRPVGFGSGAIPRDRASDKGPADSESCLPEPCVCGALDARVGMPQTRSRCSVTFSSVCSIHTQTRTLWHWGSVSTSF